jgi:hypothetical protein
MARSADTKSGSELDEQAMRVQRPHTPSPDKPDVPLRGKPAGEPLAQISPNHTRAGEGIAGAIVRSTNDGSPTAISEKRATR